MDTSDTSPSENLSFTPTTTSTTEKKGKSKLLIILIAILLIGAGIFFGFKNSQKKQEKKEEMITPTEAPLPTAEPTASPSATVVPTKKPTPTVIPTTGAITSALDMNVRVLNGSGVVGAAASASAFLKDKGYKNTSTDNADNNDFTGVTVKVKSARSSFLSKLVNDLKEKYTITASSSDLADSSSFDAQVIVGK